MAMMLALLMIMMSMPAEFMKALAEDDPKVPAVVNDIFVGKTFDKDINPELTYIEIRGTGLEGKTVTMFSPAQGSVDLNSIMSRTIDSDTLIKFLYSKKEKIEIESISVDGSKAYYLGEGSGMPNLTRADRIVSVNGNISITGSNLDSLKNGNIYQTEIDGVIINPSKITITPNTDNEQAVISEITGQPGKKDIVFRKNEASNNDPDPADYEPNKTILYTYRSQFTLTQEIDTGGYLQMIPISGKQGDTVYFKANKLELYDVFLLKEQSDAFKNTNKLSDMEFKADAEETIDILQGKVPNIEAGEYYVYLTNKTVTANPSDEISRLKMVVDEDGDPLKFKIVEGKKTLSISYVNPDKGSTIGEKATVVGQVMGSLNVEDLILTNADPTSVMHGGDLMKVVYGSGSYQGETVTKVEKTIKIIIGRTATFTDQYTFNNVRDEVEVQIAPISEDDEDLVKDVVVETETILYGTGNKIIAKFPERAILENAYTFIPSMVRPTSITSIAPELIHVIGNPGAYQTEKKILIGLHGSDFLINSYKDTDGSVITHYPVVKIGPITIDKNQNKVISGGQEIDTTGLMFYVLNDQGKILDGTEGNELGTKILFELPAGVQVTNAVKADVTVTNPIRNAVGLGHSLTETNLTEFVAISDGAPKIVKVDPFSVITQGGQEVTIEGSSFQPGVKVYIDGEEVTGVNREDENLIKFSAPPGREGMTQLQVMNPDGGIDVNDFIYVATYTDPKLTSITPNWGMNGTLVVANGSEFAKPNPNGSDQSVLDMYKLIGTRMLFGGQDYNKYNVNDTTGRIELKPFKSKEDDKLLYLENSRIKIAKYNNSIVLKNQGDNDFYTISQELDGSLILFDGGERRYTLQSVGSAIIAVDRNNIEHDVQVDREQIVIDPGKAEAQILKLMTPFHMVGNDTAGYTIDGNMITTIQKEFIYFKVPALPTKGTYYVQVINPDTKTAPAQGLPFEYKQPDTKPTITKIEPNMGSIDGGYFVTITGTGFEDDGIDKTHVFIDGTEVNTSDVRVSADGTEISVKIPPYRKNDITFDKTVPVVVINNNGGTASVEEGFTYVKPSTEPEIRELRDKEGDTVGGEQVIVIGRDFLFREPFEDLDGGLEYSAGEPFVDKNRNKRWDADETFTDENGNGVYDRPEKYIDVNGNGKYDDYRALENYGDIDPESDEAAEIRAVLPQVFFDDQRAEVVEWIKGRVTVVAPKGKQGAVDVYLMNNDFGISNKVKYTYKTQSPAPTDLSPDRGTLKGGTDVIVYGEYFKEGEIKIFGEENPVKMMLVRFGTDSALTNEGDLQSGRIINGLGSAELKESGLIVTYDAKIKDNHKLTLNLMQTIEGVNKEYEKIFENYQDDTVYIKASELELKSNTAEKYPYEELIKITVDQKERRLVVERGFAPTAKLEVRGIKLVTPSYYTVGKVPVKVYNPDGASGIATKEYKYTNPLMDMTMTDIKDTSPKKELIEIEGEDPYYLITATTQVHLKFSIIGSGFTKDSIIRIGGKEVSVPQENITEKKIDVLIDQPKGFTLDQNLVVTVENEDNAVASWDDTMVENRAVYIKFIETNFPQPKIDEIFVTEKMPNSGHMLGGYKMKIIGINFAVTKDLKNTVIKIGGKETPVLSYEILDDGRMSLEVDVPKGDAPGPVDIYARNEVPLGESVLANGFTYLKSPTIESIFVDEKRPTSGSILGGYPMQIIGHYFAAATDLEAMEVKIGDIVTPVKKHETREDGKEVIYVVVPEGVKPGKVDVYVSNKDPFGEDKLVDAFTYISSPQIDEVDPAEWYMTGDQEVIIRGINFIDGVKLKVGETPLGEVEFVSSEELKIKTIPGEKGPATLYLENPDGGKYQFGITYVIPYPRVPMNFQAIPGSERSMTLQWEATELAVKYKIFAKEGDYSDNIDDYLFAGETKDFELIVRDLKPKTKYTFVLFGINEYGDSEESAYATAVTLDAKQDVDDLKYDDDSIEFMLDIRDNIQTAFINLPKIYYPIRYDIDLTKPEYGDIEHMEINIPLEAFEYDFGNLVVKNDDVKAVFSIRNIKSGIENMEIDRRSEDANVKLKIDKMTAQEAYRLTKKLQRGEKAISEAYKVSMTYQDKRNQTELMLKQKINFGMLIPPLDGRDYKQVYFRMYDPAMSEAKKVRTIIETGDEEDYVYGEILEGGAFIVVE